MPNCDLNKAALLKPHFDMDVLSHFGMGVLL